VTAPTREFVDYVIIDPGRAMPWFDELSTVKGNRPMSPGTIMCVGETLEEREGRTESILVAQTRAGLDGHSRWIRDRL
jgi:hypothetical protein